MKRYALIVGGLSLIAAALGVIWYLRQAQRLEKDRHMYARVHQKHLDEVDAAILDYLKQHRRLPSNIGELNAVAAKIPRLRVTFEQKKQLLAGWRTEILYSDVVLCLNQPYATSVKLDEPLTVDKETAIVLEEKDTSLPVAEDGLDFQKRYEGCKSQLANNPAREKQLSLKP